MASFARHQAAAISATALNCTPMVARVLATAPMQAARFRRKTHNVVINLLLGPYHEDVAAELLASRVIPFLPRFELAADCLKLDEVDARKPICGPSDDAIRPALRRRVELFAHAAMQLDLINKVLLDLGFLRVALEFTGAHLLIPIIGKAFSGKGEISCPRTRRYKQTTQILVAIFWFIWGLRYAFIVDAQDWIIACAICC